MRGVPRRLIVTIAVGMSVLGAGRVFVGSSGAAASLTPAAIARTDAATLIGQVRLPAGSHRVPAEPAGDGGRLATPGSGPAATPNVVDVGAWWTTSTSPAATIAYVEANAPPGTTTSGTGSFGSPGSPGSQFVAFEWTTNPSSLASRVLVVTVTQLAGGGSAVRADAQVVWITQRPTSERIPAARLLVVSAPPAAGGSGAARSSPFRPVTVTSMPRIDAVSSLLNGFGVTQPGVFSCPAFGFPAHQVKLAFFSRPGDKSPAAVAQFAPGLAGVDYAACGGSVLLTLAGKNRPSLDPTITHGALAGRIDRLLGIALPSN